MTSLLLLLPACELYRGPWGGWALFGEGERRALGTTGLPAVVDATRGVLTRTEADGIVPDWSVQVTVEGQGLLGAYDADAQVLTLFDLDGLVVDQVPEVPLSEGDRTNVMRSLRMGVDTAGELIAVHEWRTSDNDWRIRIHRQAGGDWTFTDVVPRDAFWRGESTGVSAHGDRVVWVDSNVLFLVDGDTLTHGTVLEQAESALFGSDGQLVVTGWQDREEMVAWGDCRVTLEGADLALVRGPGGDAELAALSAQGELTRSPLSSSDCTIDTPRVRWPQGFLHRDRDPLVWGDAVLLAQVFDEDPLYAHPAPKEWPDDYAVDDWDWAETRFDE